MITTPGDNATTWRDLADQLTPEQIAEIEYCRFSELHCLVQSRKLLVQSHYRVPEFVQLRSGGSVVTSQITLQLTTRSNVPES